MIRHMCLSVRGALNWPKSQMKRFAPCVTIDDGRRLQTADELRDFLLDQLSMGREVLPMRDCEGFDYKTGCPGHEAQGGGKR